MKFLLAFLCLFLFSTLCFAAQPMSEATIDPTVILQLIQAHAWWALAAFAIGFVVRMLKDDSFVLPKWATVPSAYRPALALGLGVVVGLLNKLASGTDWKTALLWGLSAATAAIFSHTLIVEAARKGRDLGTPKDDAIATPRTDQRGFVNVRMLAVVTGIAALLMFAFGVLTSGCKLFNPKTEADVANETICILEHASLPPLQIAAACGVQELQVVTDILAAHDRLAARQLVQCAKAAP